MAYLRFARQAVAALFVSFILVQCCFPEPTPTPVPSPPSLAPVLEARSIRIQRHQEYGISTRSWVSEYYNLDRGGDQFRGKAEFVVRGITGKLHSVEEIAIPLGVAQSFLQMLAGVPLMEGDYERPVPCTDCYRFSIRIDLALETGKVALFMESPGDFDDVPWAVRTNGQIYLINSNAPLRALQVLEPYLEGDVLERLINESRPP